MKDKEPSLEDYPTLKEYVNVFGEFPRFLLKKDIGFSIDLMFGDTSMSKTSYTMRTQ